MITAREFVSALTEQGVRLFTGVPCSYFVGVIEELEKQTSAPYVIAPNEGSALALASGASLAGQLPAVLIQNSGLGNLINPLSSLTLIYQLPVLLIISARGCGADDQPQHRIMGRTTRSLLDLMPVEHADIPADPKAFRQAVRRAIEAMQQKRQPYAFILHPDTLAPAIPSVSSNETYPLSRAEAIRNIADQLSDEECIVATTGKPSRELMSLADRPGNLYLQGAMGHAAAVGCGIALSRPQRKVVVLDGDGSLLMHLGMVSSIGYCQPANFYHIVLDNEAYESTGAQPTTSAKTDMVAIARACGYKMGWQVSTESELKAVLAQMLNARGPCLLRVKVNCLPNPKLPRVSGQYTPEQISQRVSAHLKTPRKST